MNEQRFISRKLPLDEDPFAKSWNPEIYNKVNDSVARTDKVTQRKSTIPFMKAVVALKGLEHDTQDKIPRNIKRKLQDVSLLLLKHLILNSTRVHWDTKKMKK